MVYEMPLKKKAQSDLIKDMFPSLKMVEAKASFFQLSPPLPYNFSPSLSIVFIPGGLLQWQKLI